LPGIEKRPEQSGLNGRRNFHNDWAFFGVEVEMDVAHRVGGGGLFQSDGFDQKTTSL
jgi:hypothetical protein